ncbi:unnamed protein product [Cyclocybe aegerita]|uniref:Uncharacterized protein n=1 Tax=Cyclocybe aegerita TaxID=1973307 RepID=A0A8S0W5C3_CYCAE|nr:unnamed protein product [Cyclocybe aegerita]
MERYADLELTRKETRRLPIAYSKSLCDLHVAPPSRALQLTRKIDPATSGLRLPPGPTRPCLSRPISFCATSKPVLCEPTIPGVRRRFSQLPDSSFAWYYGVATGVSNYGDDHGLPPPTVSRPPTPPGSVVSTSQLRRPQVVNAHPSWRQGTDFGLGRHFDDILPLESKVVCDDSSVVSSRSTPIAIHGAIDSDAVSSLYNCTSFDFPEPPPIGSPVIRRMRSSPWFGLDSCEGELLNRVFENSWKGKDELAVPTNGVLDHGRRKTLQKSLSFSEDPHKNDCVDLEQLGEVLLSLDMNQRQSTPLDVSHFGDLSNASDLLQWSTSHRSTPRSLTPKPADTPVAARQLPAHWNGCAAETPSKPAARQEPSSFTRLPRIIRKVASMRSDTQKPMDVPPHIPSRKSIPKSRSFRSILRSSTGDRVPSYGYKAEDMQQSNWSSTGQGHKIDSAKSRRQHLSTPYTTGLGLYTPGFERVDVVHDSLDSKPLAAPFVHRSASKDASAKGIQLGQETTPRSFIDITPERNMSSDNMKATVKKERVKNFISKAGSFFAWGKGHRRRKNAAHQ